MLFSSLSQQNNLPRNIYKIKYYYKQEKFLSLQKNLNSMSFRRIFLLVKVNVISPILF